MLASYHNHSTFSDGKADVEAVIAAAKKLGVDELGISDHLTLPPAGDPPAWSMKPGDLEPYVKRVRYFQFVQELPLRLGLELDWFERQEDVLREIVEHHPFDFVIGSVHYVGGFPVDGNPHRWNKLTQDEIDEIHRGYWLRVRTMAHSRIFDLAAHLDLPKKFNHLPREQPWDLIDAALDAIADSGMVVELNTAGWKKECGDAYPSAEILRGCCGRDIPVTLSADAHDLVRDFARGAARLREVGYVRVARFHNRIVRFEPIDETVAGGPIPPPRPEAGESEPAEK